MKAILTSPFNAISASVHSHRAAQAVIYADQLKSIGRPVDIDYGNKLNYADYNVMYVYHGNDFSGVLNMFGGVKDFGGIDRIIEFSKFNGACHSLAIPMPNYYKMLKARVDGSDKANPKWKDVDWDGLNEKCNGIRSFNRGLFFDQNELNYYNERQDKFPKNSEIVIGDSHAISLYKPGIKMNCIPFKTLHGAMSEGLIESIVSKHIGSLPDLSLYFGNIDIRHHLCRQPDPTAAAKTLAKKYIGHAQRLLNEGIVGSVKIWEPLPIENESRAIPKTGWYKGTPFFGSWHDRNNIRRHFINELQMLAKPGIEIVEWTEYLLNDKGELDFKHMEKPRSVHLSRVSYPRWTGLEAPPYLNIEPPKETIGIEGFFDD